MIESWYDTNAIDGDWNIRKHIFETRAGVFILCGTWYGEQKSIKEDIRWHIFSESIWIPEQIID